MPRMGKLDESFKFSDDPIEDVNLGVDVKLRVHPLPIRWKEPRRGGRLANLAVIRRVLARRVSGFPAAAKRFEARDRGFAVSRRWKRRAAHIACPRLGAFVFEFAHALSNAWIITHALWGVIGLVMFMHPLKNGEENPHGFVHIVPTTDPLQRHVAELKGETDIAILDEFLDMRSVCRGEFLLLDLLHFLDDGGERLCWLG